MVASGIFEEMVRKCIRACLHLLVAGVASAHKYRSSQLYCDADPVRAAAALRRCVVGAGVAVIKRELRIVGVVAGSRGGRSGTVGVCARQ